LLLHGSDRVRYNRSTGSIKAYNDPEWQAKAFAGEFLVAAHLVHKFKTIREVAEGFGVSIQAAEYQLYQYLKEGIIKEGQIIDLASR